MKTLLLLHGALGSQTQLQSLKENLSQMFDLHILDFPGHGGTSLPESFSIPAFSTFVKDYIQQHQLTNVNIFGYSMGGYVACYLAIHHPGLVQRIATLATKFHWTEDIAARETKMLQPDVIEQKLPAFAQTLQQRHAPQDWKILLNKTAAMLLSMGKNNPLAIHQYKELNIPVMVMLGDRDKMVSLEETTEVYKQLQQGSMAMLPQTPHPIETVDMKLLGFMIDKFLAE